MPTGRPSSTTNSVVMRLAPMFMAANASPANASGAIVFGWLTVTEAIPQILAAFGGAQ